MESRVLKTIKRRLLEDILIKDIDNIDKRKIEIFSIIPELKNEDGFKQNHPHHCYDVWKHTCVALQNSDNDLEVRIALLLHDIGKPYSYQDEEVRHFHGHPEVGAEMTKDILTRMDYKKQQIEDIYFLVKNHDTIIDIKNINPQNIDINKKLLHIQYCDAKAHHPEHIEKRINKLIVRY